MNSTASIRDLRNRFPHVRKLLQAEGEVLLTEGGKVKYRLLLHTPVAKPAAAVDYWSRLTADQPTPISAAKVRALVDENRGDR